MLAEPVSAVRPTDRATMNGSRGAIENAPSTQSRLLVADADVTLLGRIRRLLGEGFGVLDFAHDGASALALATEYPHAVIVLARTFTDLDGLEVLDAIRRADVRSPILILGSDSTARDRVVCLDAGADDYLSRPFAVEELAARLRALARRGRAC